MKSPKTQTQKIPKLFYQKIQQNWPEMGPCGWVWAHIKKGRTYMAQDHLETPPDHKQIHERFQNDPKTI